MDRASGRGGGGGKGGGGGRHSGRDVLLRPGVCLLLVIYNRKPLQDLKQDNLIFLSKVTLPTVRMGCKGAKFKLGR